MNDNKYMPKPGWFISEESSDGTSCTNDGYVRTLKSAEIISGILEGDYESFCSSQSKEVKISEDTFRSIRYYIGMTLKTADDEKAMNVYAAAKNNANAETKLLVSNLNEKSRKKFTEALKINVDIREFISSRDGSLEKLEHLLNFSIDAVKFYLVYKLVEFQDATSTENSFALNEQLWKEFRWASDSILYMMNGCSAPCQVRDLFYAGLKDLRGGE